MPRTLEGTRGPVYTEGVRLQESADALEPGAIRYQSGAFVLRDEQGSFDPRTGGEVAEYVLTAAGTLVYVGDGDLVTV